MAKKPAKLKKMKKVAKKIAKPAKKAPAKSAGKVMAAPVSKARVSSKPRNTSTLSYTQSEFVENVRAFCGLNKRSEAKQIVEDIAAFVMDSLRKGYKIPLMGLGKLYVRETKARQGRNPATGEVINIPKRKRVKFTAAKALKERVL
ncbi:MAG: HU family DNA-binding protein [Pseudomonadota bacterium]|jgi:DNA-binding protein HU-beta